jgi:hypothetical protein
MFGFLGHSLAAINHENDINAKSSCGLMFNMTSASILATRKAFLDSPLRKTMISSLSFAVQ